MTKIVIEPKVVDLAVERAKREEQHQHMVDSFAYFVSALAATPSRPWFAWDLGEELPTVDWTPLPWVVFDEAPPRRWYEGLLWWLGFKRYA